jgi:hypothetical protein
LTYHFGLKPWDVDRLSLVEFDAYCSEVDSIEKERGSRNG